MLAPNTELNEIDKLVAEFQEFYDRNFRNKQLAWRNQLTATFNAVSLTEIQCSILSDPQQATAQFRSFFERALSEKPSSPQSELMSAFMEPVNKIAQYFESAKRLGGIEIGLARLAAIGQTLPHNLRIILGEKTPPDALKVYKELAELGKRAEDILTKNGCSPITDIRGLDGMHHIGSLPDNFANGPC